ncbi:MAG TPA: SDR family oxidoreductase [Solirubrobacterales bacterium]|nr:SDR family oxidoreductase [Solirubrobacterales bacterium]
MPQTALVTGASSGIGEQFARQLAGRGHDLILVARRQERLEQLAGELPGTARVVPCDLASDAGSLAGRVAELGVDVDLLVNNAGFGTYGHFVDLDPEREAEEVRVNCEAVVTLTHDFLPAMVERGDGGVIVVASTAGMQPIPYEATYSASKAFALHFTEALHEELRGTGVRMLAVNPGPVPTEWQQIAGHDDTGIVPGEIPAEQVVRESLEAYDAGRRSVIPGRTIRWFIRAGSVGPRALQLRVTERIFRRGLTH